MPAVQETVDQVRRIDVDQYKYGFETLIESDKAPKGLSEDTVRFISAKKDEPAWMLEWRLDAYRRWLTMREPQWARVELRPDRLPGRLLLFRAERTSRRRSRSTTSIRRSSRPTRSSASRCASARRCSASCARTVEGEEAAAPRSRVAVDAVFDSVSVATTFKEELKKAGVIFMPISEALREHPDLVKQYLGSVVPVSDNFFATLNSAVFSDGSFVYVPPGVRCPMELSTYFRINEKNTGQFERTLIIADKGSYVSYLEGCTAPMRDENQLHAAVVELIAHEDAEIKYSTIQNWYPGDAQGRGGIYNFVTKRGDCRGANSKISWTQVETGSAITWKYPSCILRGDDSRGEFYSIAISNGHQAGRQRHQDDPSRQEHDQPDHLQGHRGRPLAEHLSRARLLAPQGQGRAQLHQLRLAADRRQVRRAHRALHRGEELLDGVRARGDHLEDLRGHAVLLPPARPHRRGGDRARGQRLRQGRAAAAADGVRRRGAEADRGEP